MLKTSRFVCNSVCACAALAMTPESQARDMSTDRPDGTESPISLDKGRFQVEASLFSYTRDSNNGTRLDAWSFAEMNLKAGITEASDLQLVISPYVTERTKSGGVTDTTDGVGDFEVRYKWNLWGNDEGETAFGLLPHVKLPSGSDVSNDHVEGGLILPLAWDFADGWGFGTQVQIDRVYSDDTRNYEWEFGHTAVVGADLCETVGVFVEYIGVAGDEPYQAYASGGFTWALNEDLQLDIAAVIGLNDDSEDLTVFQGFSWRF